MNVTFFRYATTVYQGTSTLALLGLDASPVLQRHPGVIMPPLAFDIYSQFSPHQAFYTSIDSI